MADELYPEDQELLGSLPALVDEQQKARARLCSWDLFLLLREGAANPHSFVEWQRKVIELRDFILDGRKG